MTTTSGTEKGQYRRHLDLSHWPLAVRQAASGSTQKQLAAVLRSAGYEHGCKLQAKALHGRSCAFLNEAWCDRGIGGQEGPR